MNNLMDKINSGRQYRNMILEIKDDSEEKEYKVRGYATTYNEPYTLYEGEGYRVDEQVAPTAFDETDMTDVIFQYDHQGRVYARISNNTLALTSDDHGLLIEADLGGTEEGRKLYDEIKGGYTTKMSFGFTVTADDVAENVEENGMHTYLRTITKVGKLFDVSAVSLPANDGTEISARNFVDGVITKFESERIQKEAEERNAKAEALERKIKLMELEMKTSGNQ